MIDAPKPTEKECLSRFNKYLLFLMITIIFLSPASAVPTITAFYNNKTGWNSSYVIGAHDQWIKFNITSDYNLDTVRWYKDGVLQSSIYDNISLNWYTEGYGFYKLEVNGTNNTEGNTATLQFNVTIEYGNITISSNTGWGDQYRVHAGNLTLGANLTLSNVTLLFNNTKHTNLSRVGIKNTISTVYFKVGNGSNISVTNTSLWTGWYYNGQDGEVQLNDSSFSYLGGQSPAGQNIMDGIFLASSTSKSFIKNNTFKYCDICLFFSTSNSISVDNNSFSYAPREDEVSYYGAEVFINIYNSNTIYVRNNTFNSSRMVIYLNYANNSLFQDNIVSNSWWYGVDIWGNSWNNNFTRNKINHSRRAVVNTGSGANHNQQFQGNTVSYGTYGTSCGSSGTNPAINFTYINQTCDNNPSGVGLSTTADNAVVKDVTITNLGYEEGFFTGGYGLMAGGYNSTYKNISIVGKSVTVGTYNGIYANKTNGYAGNNGTVENISVSNIDYGILISDLWDMVFRDINITSIKSGGYDLITQGNLSRNKLINTNLNWSRRSIEVSDTIDVYYYADIYVKYSNGTACNGCTINITNEVNSSYPSINRNGANTTSFTTEADGHTPLPAGNNTNTVVLMNRTLNATATVPMTFVISATDGSKTGSITGVAPNTTWYRNNNNINMYQNTITVTLSEPSAVVPSSYVRSTCASTLNWGIVGASLIGVLIIVIAGILAIGFLATGSKDTSKIIEFALVITSVVVIGSIGVALISPIITAVGCP